MPRSEVKVAFVVQRYGSDVVGGAEHLTRQVCERLAQAAPHWQIHVLTTCARDYRTWRNEYGAGVEHRRGVTIHRFPVVLRRSRWIFGLLNRLTSRWLRQHATSKRWSSVRKGIEKIWYLAQGPWCPELVSHLQKQPFDLAVFVTYLYYPTVEGIRAFPGRSVIVPAAHDEPPLYFATTREALMRASQIFANSPAELGLLQSSFPDLAKKMSIVGVGIDQPQPETGQGSAESPYLLYLGRIGRGKSVDELITFFLDYLRTRGDKATKLLLAGLKEENFFIPEHPQIVFVGQVTEEEKGRLIGLSAGVINPSKYESLSLVVLEGIASEVPILVNADSETLASYAQNVPSVFAYSGSEEFACHLERVLHDPPTDHQMRESSSWLEQNFGWERVLSSYRSLVDEKSSTASESFS